MDHIQVFRVLLDREHRNGASVENLALTFGISEAAVEDHLACASPRCCDEPTCPRADLARLMTPTDPLERQVERLAHAVAQTCVNLSEEDLRHCFSQFLQIGAECQLFDRFRRCYRGEEDTLEAAAS